MYKSLIRFLFGYKTFSYIWLLIVCIRLTELIFCGLYSMKMIELHILRMVGSREALHAVRHSFSSCFLWNQTSKTLVLCKERRYGYFILFLLYRRTYSISAWELLCDFWYQLISGFWQCPNNNLPELGQCHLFRVIAIWALLHGLPISAHSFSPIVLGGDQYPTQWGASFNDT